MTRIIYGAVLALSLIAVAPVSAQGIYVGPNGVGVDSGVRPDYGNDRDRYRDHDRDVRQGRSAYDHRDSRHHGEDEQD